MSDDKVLTKAQVLALKKSAKPGGVVGFGQKYKVVGPLKTAGLVQPLGRHGYMVITESGRMALGAYSEFSLGEIDDIYKQRH